MILYFYLLLPSYVPLVSVLRFVGLECCFLPRGVRIRLIAYNVFFFHMGW